MKDGVLDVGNEKQLFLDGALIDSEKDVSLRTHKPVRDGRVLIEPDRPWEDRIGSYSCVLKEDGKIRIWYDCRQGDEIRLAYAESEDGIHFTKPEIGLHEVDGSKANNIVLPGPRIAGGAVWRDPNAQPEHRYKTQTKVYPSGELHMHSSPDGIHWKHYATPDIGDKDTQSVIFWDPHHSCYLLYTRKWVQMEERSEEISRQWHNAYRYRTVRRLESQDLRCWENERIVMEPDEIDRAVHDMPTPRPPVDFYGAGVFPYEGADRTYLMFLQTFWHWVKWDKEGLGPSSIDVQLAASRDGKKFHRLGNRRPFMELGPEGRFDSRFVWAMPRPVRMGDELWIYYVGLNREHGPSGDLDPVAGRQLSGIGRAVLRLDGFVSVSGDYGGGWFTTPPLRFEGNRLEINADAGGGGSLEVELLDMKGDPIRGFTREESIPVTYNSVRLPVQWDGQPDLGSLAGSAVRIRFFVTNADLYAFQFRDSTAPGDVG